MIEKAIEVLNIVKNHLESNKALCPFPQRDLIYSIFFYNNSLKEEFISAFPIDRANEFQKTLLFMTRVNSSSDRPPNDLVGALGYGEISRRDLINKIDDILNELNKKSNAKVMRNVMINQEDDYDLFISHASEDKDALARPLTKKLLKLGYHVFLDELAIKLGDSITESINKGLSKSEYCILIVSPTFLEKNWTKAELNSITNMYIGSNKKILPIWHNVTYDEIKRTTPLLIDLRAADSSKGIDYLIDEITKSIGKPKHKQTLKTNYTWNFHDFSEEVQTSFLKHLAKIYEDIDLMCYHEALEDAMIFLDSIRNHGISDAVVQEFEKTYEQFKRMLMQDEQDLWNDR